MGPLLLLGAAAVWMMARSKNNKQVVLGAAGYPRLTQVSVSSMKDRVALIHQCIIEGSKDPDVISLARRIVSARCGSKFCAQPKDYVAYADLLWDWQHGNISYCQDPPELPDMYEAASAVLLRDHCADCDGHTIAMGAMCRSLGFTVATSIVELKPEYAQGAIGGHIWPMVGIPMDAPEAYYPLDCTEPNGPGWCVPMDWCVPGPNGRRDYIVGQPLR